MEPNRGIILPCLFPAVFGPGVGGGMAPALLGPGGRGPPAGPEEWGHGMGDESLMYIIIFRYSMYVYVFVYVCI